MYGYKSLSLINMQCQYKLFSNINQFHWYDKLTIKVIFIQINKLSENPKGCD